MSENWYSCLNWTQLFVALNRNNYISPREGGVKLTRLDSAEFQKFSRSRTGPRPLARSPRVKGLELNPNLTRVSYKFLSFALSRFFLSAFRNCCTVLHQNMRENTVWDLQPGFLRKIFVWNKVDCVLLAIVVLKFLVVGSLEGTRRYFITKRGDYPRKTSLTAFAPIITALASQIIVC